ncbi:hypothetical protein I7I50_03887 [Histoplasma capsulatum G186AR]|uniref:F-box domain-containing protein n=1 Tax=Ajellomyces capsulatus TaxID=5037 RepID=A0A8H7YP05_AJECA|nr:hypothetical protein I7I52_04795 [Histoplasma capsulatum]QSS74922.1 hypothetical protein I7I50_03887 [Histoplasma capsulatum G186AR]
MILEEISLKSIAAGRLACKAWKAFVQGKNLHCLHLRASSPWLSDSLVTTTTRIQWFKDCCFRLKRDSPCSSAFSFPRFS